jgi:hypothetical protein
MGCETDLSRRGAAARPVSTSAASSPARARQGTNNLKPNYNFQKAERDREKQAKKEAKLREKAARKQEAKAGDGGEAPERPETDPPAS